MTMTGKNQHCNGIDMNEYILKHTKKIITLQSTTKIIRMISNLEK